jgi:signal transduction histidine kinase
MNASGRRRFPGSTAFRLWAALAAIVALFGVALGVMLFALQRIAAAEEEVAELDHAKHAGHLAAAQARDQYIHQAHTIINWDSSHLGHYEQVAKETRRATEHLQELARTSEEKAWAAEIAWLARQNDDEFRRDVLGAIARDDRAAARGLHERTDALVARVVAVNERLNRSFEAHSERAAARAERIRDQARIATLLCFGLAIALATVVGLLLIRSILGPLSALRAGAQRVGSGDLGARVELEGTDELAEVAAAFNQMTADLARHQDERLRIQKLATIGKLAAGIAHEINNPLGVILGYARLLGREASLAGREELGIIQDEVLQCQKIVQGLLDLARPQSLDLAEVDVVALVDEAVERLGETGQLGGVTVEVTRAEKRVVASADEAKMRQVILNLVLNAAQAATLAATEDGASPARVVVNTTEDANGVALRVSDNGPGIPADVRSRLFDPFVTTKKQGTGLGLSIAHAIVDAHGGRILIEDAEGGGTRVTVRLPRGVAVERPEELSA